MTDERKMKVGVLLDKFDTILLIILAATIIMSAKMMNACYGLEGLSIVC